MGNLWTSNPPPMAFVAPKERVTDVVRLRNDQLVALRRQLGGANASFVTHQTTDIQAGFQLGINHVLGVLAEGFTDETPVR